MYIFSLTCSLIQVLVSKDLLDPKWCRRPIGMEKSRLGVNTSDSRPSARTPIVSRLAPLSTHTRIIYKGVCDRCSTRVPPRSGIHRQLYGPFLPKRGGNVSENGRTLGGRHSAFRTMEIQLLPIIH